MDDKVLLYGRDGLDSRTVLYCLLGNPVKQSLSPYLHNSAFSSLAINSCYLSFELESSALEDVVKGLRACNFGGCNITTPFKRDILPLIDVISPEAKLIGSVNTVVNRGGILHGYSTDGEGFCRFLAENNINPAEKDVLMVGAGGAAVAVSFSLAKAGISSLTVANRSPGRAIDLCRLIEDNYSAKVKSIPLEEEPLAEALERASLIVNGLSLDAPALVNLLTVLPEDENKSLSLSAEKVFADLRYRPQETELMKLFRLRGGKAYNGKEMLLWQAALAFEIFTDGIKAPLDVMREAINL